MPFTAGRNTNLNDLPVGFSVLDPISTLNHIGMIALSHSHATHDPSRVGGGRQLYSIRYRSLFEWAATRGFELAKIHDFRPSISRTNGERMAMPPTRLPDRWYVSPNPGTLVQLGYALADLGVEVGSFTCPLNECGMTHPFGTIVCPDTLTMIVCTSCGRTNAATPAFVLTDTGPFDAANVACPTCGVACEVEGCTAFAQGSRYCGTHGHTVTCAACMCEYSWRTNEEPLAVQVPAGTWICIERCGERICGSCSNYSRHPLVYSARLDASVCPACMRNELRHENEAFDTDADGDNVEPIPTIPGRETIRSCGIEIEGANGTHGANDLALEIYRQGGLSTADRMVDHGAGSRYGLVHVEYDNSVDWECVIGPLNMAAADDALVLDKTIKTIRRGIKSGRYKLDLRAGVHIHISAARTGLAQAYNLSHIFTYLEDPLFRIGAAKWPFHRASQGSTYCAPIPKHSRKLDFYSNHGGNGRDRHRNHYYALSFSNYFNAMMRNCGCGAVQAGVWDECTCPDLGKCTFEFRLFNTTANSKKMKAYLALCQAMVAKALSLPEIRQPHDEMPGLPFNQRVFKEMEDEDRNLLVNAWRPRLAYIFGELPLTDDEKEAILYCVKNCEISHGLTEDEIVELANTPGKTEELEVVA